jgi:hypothetical protein
LDNEMTDLEMTDLVIQRKPEMKISTPEKRERQNNGREMNTKKTKQRKIDGYFKVIPDCRI